MKPKRQRCAVINCLEGEPPFHHFPREITGKRFKAWVEASGDYSLYHEGIHKLVTAYFICHRHFEQKYISRNGRLINSVAVPTLNLPSMYLSALAI